MGNLACDVMGATLNFLSTNCMKDQKQERIKSTDFPTCIRHVLDKGHACYGLYTRSEVSIEGKQCRLPAGCSVFK